MKYALSAKHVLEVCANWRLYEKTEQFTVGNYVGFGGGIQSASRDLHIPFYNTIGAVRLNLENLDEISNGPLIGIGAPRDLLGRRLLKHDGSETAPGCTLTGFGGEVVFTDPYTGAWQLFDQVVMVSFDSSDSVRPGDAGSVLASEAGMAVAILISAGDQYYAAPLAPYLDRYALKMIHPPSAASNNDYSVPTTITEDVAQGVVAMAAAVASEPSVHRDPAGRNVPAHLLDLLLDA